MEQLLQEISHCTLCAAYLEHQPRPVLSVHPNCKVLIIGQAPGSIVHRTGIPWDDKSGDKLRQWMNIDKKQFYDNTTFGIIPMGFCYPGKGKTGDLPPRKECAPKWHQALFDQLNNVELIVLIGKYAQDYYLSNQKHKNLTETVRNYDQYLPQYFPLPHPSPRNNIWMKRNDWFDRDIIPHFKEIIHTLISQNK